MSVATILVSALFLAATGAQPAEPTETAKGNVIKVNIVIEGSTTVTATLDDTEASRDFFSLLPLELTLKDYNGTEKVSDLPKKLSTKGAPAGHKPVVGDVTYYAPGGNLAIFHRDFEYSSGLIKLGKIDANVAALVRSRPFKVRIERADKTTQPELSPSRSGT